MSASSASSSLIIPEDVEVSATDAQVLHVRLKLMDRGRLYNACLMFSQDKRIHITLSDMEVSLLLPSGFKTRDLVFVSAWSTRFGSDTRISGDAEADTCTDDDYDTVTSDSSTEDCGSLETDTEGEGTEDGSEEDATSDGDVTSEPGTECSDDVDSADEDTDTEDTYSNPDEIDVALTPRPASPLL